MSFSMRLTHEEELLIKRYADMHKQTVSDVMRTAILEKIEDEFDLKEYDLAMEAYRKNPVSYTLHEVERMLDEE